MTRITLLAAALAGAAALTACDLFGDDREGSGADEPAPVLLEALPIDLATLNYDSIVARRQGREVDWSPLHDFGQVFPANEDRPMAKTNPQPTFYAPLGTPVVAIVTGTVTAVVKLYSNDTSVMITATGISGAPIWEMEHIIAVRVRVGDHVKAGDTIAAVSDYECKWGRNSNPADPLCASGLGLVEIGLLYGGNPPEHRCPFEDALVAPTRRALIFGRLDSARVRIEAAMDDTTLYDEAGRATPQCISISRVPG